MKKFLFILLIVLLAPFAGFAEEEMEKKSGYIQVTIENRSAFPNLLQVRDDICGPSQNGECEEARLALKSNECQKDRFAKKCKKAREKIESAHCLEDLVYEGMVDSGQKIQVSICKSPAGNGNLSIRAINPTSPWIRYFLINNGDTISY